MSTMKYPELFEPFNIGTLTIKNRIVMAPMDPKRDPKGEPYSKKTRDYYVERAKGGAGLIVTGCLCQPFNVEGGIAVATEFKYEKTLRKNLKKLVEEVHAAGAKLFTQTWLNFGRSCFPVSVVQRVAASEGPNLWAPELTNRELKTWEVDKIIESNVKVARICYECGVDGISIVGPYGGYLSDQFGTAAWNHRTDKYGGSVRKRARAVCDLISGIKEACGEDFPVAVRMSTRHHIEGVHKGQIPGQPYKEYGRDVDESIQLAKYYVNAGADAFLTSNGCYDALYWQYSPMYLPEAEWVDDVAPLTAAIDVPTICAGRLLMPSIANKAIKEGKITAACLGRPLLADPYWANKAKEGREEDIRPCIGCNNGCIGRVMNAQSVMCAVNANIYHEGEQEFVPALKPKKVAVIGAGVGGMEAARVAKLRGHDVEIYEKSGITGGIFNAAAKPEFKHGDERLLAWYEKQMKDLDIPIHFNTALSADEIEALGADEVIIATGSQPKCPPIPGLDKANMVYATDVLNGKAKTGKKVVIMGAGLIGCECALEVSQDDDKEVTLVDIVRYVMTGGIQQPPTPSLEYMERVLDWKPNIDLKMRSMVTGMDENSVTIHTTDVGDSKIDADTVVMAVGLKSENTLYQELKPKLGDRVHIVGDAEQIGTIMTAVHSATRVAKAI